MLKNYIQNYNMFKFLVDLIVTFGVPYPSVRRFLGRRLPRLPETAQKRSFLMTNLFI